jgi:hypothetical protein
MSTEVEILLIRHKTVPLRGMGVTGLGITDHDPTFLLLIGDLPEILLPLRITFRKVLPRLSSVVVVL